MVVISFAFSGWHTIAGYRILFANKEQIENGIEQWLKHEPNYHNYDEWKKIREKPYPPPNIRDSVRTNKYLKELQNSNYYFDFMGNKVFQIFDPITSIHYNIQILKPVIGWDLSVMNIDYSDGRYAGFIELTDVEIKYALKNFEKNILPQIKDYVRLVQKKR